MRNIYFRLRGPILRQNIHDCVKLFRDRKVAKEVGHGVEEPFTEKNTRGLNFILDDAGAALVQSLKISLKQATIYARH